MPATLELLRRRAEATASVIPFRIPSGLICAVAVVALSTFAYAALLRAGVILTGDTAHAMRIYEMDRCLGDGQIPCRWATDLGNGYGQPLFNYYAPLPYYAGALLHRLGFSYLRSADLLFALGLVGCGLSMFVLGRRLWGDIGGMVSAVVFVYAPYLGFNAYLRGALLEVWGLAVTPLLLWAVHELVTTGRRRYIPAVAFFSALLVLSHTLVTMIVAPAVVVWAAALLAVQGRDAWRRALLGTAAVAWGFSLAAFFAVPVLTEGHLIQVDNLTLPPLDFANNFSSVHDLFLVRSADYSFIIDGKGAPIQIGWAQWALAGLALPATLFYFRQRRLQEALAILVFALVFAFAAFMSVSRSKFVWDAFDSLRFIQLPFRYVGLASLASGLLAGAWFPLVRRRHLGMQLLLGALIIAVAIGLGQPFFKPYFRCTEDTGQQYPCSWSDDSYFSPRFFPFQQSSGLEAYLPTTVGSIPRSPPSVPASVVAGSAELSDVSSGSDWLHFSVDARTRTTVQASIFDFPHWRVSIDGHTTAHSTSKPEGLVTFSVPGGAHRIEIQLEDTGVRRLGNIISLLSWTALLITAGAMIAGSLRVDPYGWRRMLSKREGRP